MHVYDVVDVGFFVPLGTFEVLEDGEFIHLKGSLFCLRVLTGAEL